MKLVYKIGNRKVVVIGAGYVGSSIAYALALRDIAREIVLIDIDKEKCAGELMTYAMEYQVWEPQIYMQAIMRIVRTVT